MKIIELTKGAVAFVDDDDFELVSKHKWCLHSGSRTLYAKRLAAGKHLTLHRFILNLDSSETLCDHIDRNGLNCQKHNMRVCAKSQNVFNQRKQVRPTYSRYKGVTWDKRLSKWQVQIGFNHKRRKLGRFSDEEDAAKAYDAAAVSLFGEFANCNFKRVA